VVTSHSENGTSILPQDCNEHGTTPTATIKTGNNWEYRLTQLKVFTATSKFTAIVQKHELNKTQRKLQKFTQ